MPERGLKGVQVFGLLEDVINSLNYQVDLIDSSKVIQGSGVMNEINRTREMPSCPNRTMEKLGGDIMTAKQEAYALIDKLPEDSIEAVIQIMIRMVPAEHNKANGAGEKKKAFPFDVFTSGLTYIADDFDATPDCFKEYM